MFLNNIEAEARLKNPQNVVVRLNMHSGNPNGRMTPISRETKEFLGTMGHLSGLRGKVLASMVGVSTSELTSCKAGERTAGVRDPLLYEAVQENVKKSKEDAKAIVVDNLLKSLGVVSAKLPGAKLLEANEVAKSSALILEKLDGGSGDGGVKVTNIVIHNPGSRPESEYMEVEVITGGK